MTFGAAVGGSLLRAMLAAVVVWPICLSLAAWLQRAEGSARRRRLWLVAGPFLFPELLVGYAAAPWVAGRPVLAEIVCGGLLALRVVPVGVVAGLLTPPATLSDSALHCRRLALRTARDWCALVRCLLAGPVVRALPALGLVLLVSFQEFELAALVRAVSWTDWLFVAQVGGLSLGGAWAAALAPTIAQTAGLLLIVWTARRLDVARLSRGPLASGEEWRPRRRDDWLSWGYLAVAWSVLIVWPLATLGGGLPAGLLQLFGQPLRLGGLLRELLVGLSASVVAAVAALALARRLTEPHAAARLAGWRLAAVVALCVPGLSGSLILSLSLLAVFQSPALSVLYDTPLAWVLGLTLFLFPRALLCEAWRRQSGGDASTALAQILQTAGDVAQRRQGSALLWRLTGEPHLLSLGMLVYWGYLDLTTSYLLAPTGLPAGVVRLYNFMHFGRTAALSAEAALLLLTPLAAGGLIWRAARWWKC